MNTLIRSTTSTITLGRRSVDGQVIPDGMRASVREKETHKRMMMTSLSYRRDRARKRQVFLKTYELSSIEINKGRKSATRVIKKVFVKAKTVAVSAFSSLLRFGDFRTCFCGSSATICDASSHVPVVQKYTFSVPESR